MSRRAQAVLGVRMVAAHVDAALYQRVAAAARANQSNIATETRRLVAAALRDEDLAASLAAYCERQAAQWEAAATGKQVRTVPEPQLYKLKAEHWRILAKVCREGPKP